MGIDWTALGEEAVGLLRRYLMIDTTNPPGNEIAAARFLAERFRTAGIEAETFESEPGRGSILARLKGSGTSRVDPSSGGSRRIRDLVAHPLDHWALWVFLVGWVEEEYAAALPGLAAGLERRARRRRAPRQRRRGA